MAACMTDRERFDPPLLRVAWVNRALLARDAFLAEARARVAAAGAPAERFASALAHGGVHLCGRPLLSHEIPEHVAADAWVRVHVFAREPETPPLPEPVVLLDRDGLVAVAKPAWWPTQGTRASRRLSLEAVLRERLACPSLRAVHRLDRETSGLALFARDAASAARAGRAFAAGGVTRRYLALASPAPQRETWRIEGWMERAADRARFRFAVREESGPARRWSATSFRLLRVSGSAALVEAWPETGRTHQVRVHLAASGAPILGDPVYGDPAAAARCMLHAASLRVAGVLASGALEAEAPLADDFARAARSAGVL
ncbi:MAG TPA: RNA pseudouridine synthase [Myxococcota bacterium]|jgi:23S rRNA pseudouridine1911/1915/1917 synthase|nr:RNA pseudouridine synthase [Myxococcota bacterium]